MPVHAFIFPGQGSQAVGMGRDLAAAFSPAREVFGEVDEALKQKLSKLMFDGPAETLTLTENTQPALLAMSMAVLRVLEAEGGFRLPDKAVLVAGHSLGEYSALAAAGSLALSDAARLLRHRGVAMQDAVPAGEGAMAALLGAVPLMLGHGTGSEIRQPLGYAMFGGLIVSQLLTLFTTPVIYLYLDEFSLRLSRAFGRKAPPPQTLPEQLAAE